MFFHNLEPFLLYIAQEMGIGFNTFFLFFVKIMGYDYLREINLETNWYSKFINNF